MKNLELFILLDALYVPLLLDDVEEIRTRSWPVQYPYNTYIVHSVVSTSTRSVVDNSLT